MSDPTVDYAKLADAIHKLKPTTNLDALMAALSNLPLHTQADQYSLMAKAQAVADQLGSQPKLCWWRPLDFDDVLIALGYRWEWCAIK